MDLDRHTRMPALVLVIAAVSGAAVLPSPSTSETAPPAVSSSQSGATRQAVELAPPRHPVERRAADGDPFAALSLDSLLSFLEELTAIGPHSGWRYSTTAGEWQAIDLVEQRLAAMGFLRIRGLEVERSTFRTYEGVNLWESRLEITLGGERFEVPANAIPGHRDNLDLALRFDSDGEPNDADRDPVVVAGSPLVVRTSSQIDGLTPAQAAGRVVFLDFALIDRVVMEATVAVERARTLIQKRPAAVVLVTSYSNRQGVSHGTFVNDVGAHISVAEEPDVPILTTTLEDLSAAGVAGWDGIQAIESARLTWDADISEVGLSGNLMARIPGADSSRAMILGAHIDSPNTPGGFDDGSGSAALLEVARVLDRTRTIPPTDLYLVWFGSEERGLYGSFSFTASHSELLDRTIAMLEMDCLGHPLDGVINVITVSTRSYSRFGDIRPLWPEYLRQASNPASASVEAVAYDYGLGSDNGPFAAYNVPNANMIYENPYSDLQVHYANHLHDPYDTLELAELEADVFGDMARIMLTAALRTPVDNPRLQVAKAPDRRALFVASHTESAHMTAGAFTDLGMALGVEGFDVDSVPYGEPVTAQELADADLVIALPVHDYPSLEGNVDLYDEAWSEAELDALEEYVRDGGLLVLTNSARRLKHFSLAYEDNEDWQDQNALAERLGVSYLGPALSGNLATAVGAHPLVQGVTTLDLADTNSHRFTAPGGQTLAQVGGNEAAAVVGVGAGEVVVLADLGILGSPSGEPQNLTFWRNLARYAW